MRLNYPTNLSYAPFMDYIVWDGEQYTIKDNAPSGIKEEFEHVKAEREKYTEAHKEK